MSSSMCNKHSVMRILYGTLWCNVSRHRVGLFYSDINMFKILASELLSKKSHTVLSCVLNDINLCYYDSCQAIFWERITSEII